MNSFETGIRFTVEHCWILTYKALATKRLIAVAEGKFNSYLLRVSGNFQETSNQGRTDKRDISMPVPQKPQSHIYLHAIHNWGQQPIPKHSPRFVWNQTQLLRLLTPKRKKITGQQQFLLMLNLLGMKKWQDSPLEWKHLESTVKLQMHRTNFSNHLACCEARKEAEFKNEHVEKKLKKKEKRSYV